MVACLNKVNVCLSNDIRTISCEMKNNKNGKHFEKCDENITLFYS